MTSFKTVKALGVALVVALILLVTYGMLFSLIRGKNEHVSALVNQLEEGRRMEQNLRSMRILLEDTQGDRARLASYFVTQDGIVDFLERLENLESVVGTDLEIRSVAIETPERDTESELLRLNLIAEGEFAAVYHLLALIESMPYGISIEQAQLQKSSRDDPFDTQWRATVSINVLKLR